MLPPWLQELRDLLAITSYNGRQGALIRWEERWLVDLHTRQLVSPEMVVAGRMDILERVSEYVQQALGQDLVKVMGELTRSESRDYSWGGEPMIEVRGDVMAIRREPKADD